MRILIFSHKNMGKKCSLYTVKYGNFTSKPVQIFYAPKLFYTVKGFYL